MILAQIPDSSAAWLASALVAVSAAIGLVLKWFMGKADANAEKVARRMGGLESGVIRLNRSILMLTYALDKSETTRREGEVMMREIERAESDLRDGGGGESK